MPHILNINKLIDMLSLNVFNETCLLVKDPEFLSSETIPTETIGDSLLVILRFAGNAIADLEIDHNLAVFEQAQRTFITAVRDDRCEKCGAGCHTIPVIIGGSPAVTVAVGP